LKSKQQQLKQQQAATTAAAPFLSWDQNQLSAPSGTTRKISSSKICSGTNIGTTNKPVPAAVPL
jgi:hypothetical protein